MINYTNKMNKTITYEVVKEAMKQTLKDVRLPKIVRDGLINNKMKNKIKLIILLLLLVCSCKSKKCPELSFTNINYTKI